MVKYPFGDDEIVDLQTHCKGIKRMKVAFDDSHIFTAGEDGMLMIFEIRDKVFFLFLLMVGRKIKKR